MVYTRQWLVWLPHGGFRLRRAENFSPMSIGAPQEEHLMANLVPPCVQKRRSDRLSW
jgi:hypothetical protein